MIRGLPFLIRSSLLAATASLVFATPSFAAEGVKLSWNHCLGEGTGVQNMAFACDTNAGTSLMVGSFVLGSDLPKAVALDGIIDIASETSELPAWWLVKGGAACRSGISANILADPADLVCLDWWYGGQGLAFAGFCAGSCTGAGPNIGRISVGGALTVGFSSDLTGGSEYFGFNLQLNHTQTVGSPNCGGCDVPVCIVFNSVSFSVATPDGFDRTPPITTPAEPGSNFVTWQGGAVPASRSIPGCPAVTATRRSAWGAVKSLYR